MSAVLLLELFVWCCMMKAIMCIVWIVKRQTIFKMIQRRGNRRQEPSVSASHAMLLQASASSRGPSQARTGINSGLQQQCPQSQRPASASSRGPNLGMGAVFDTNRTGCQCNLDADHLMDLVVVAIAEDDNGDDRLS